MATDTASNVTPIRSVETVVSDQLGQGQSVRLSAPQRVAIVVAMLGEDTARPIMDKLNDHSLGEISEALESMSRMGRESLMSVVMDFLQQLRASSDDFHSGRLQILDLMKTIVGTRQQSEGASVTTNSDGEDLLDRSADNGGEESAWIRLGKMAPSDIATYMNRLSPNLISMILRRLPNATSSEVISELSEDKLKPVVGCLVEPDDSDAEVDAVLAKMVEMELLNVADDRTDENKEHLDDLGELLSLINSERRQLILGYLQSNHESEFAGIQKSIFSIEKLPEILPRKFIPIATRQLDATALTRFIASLKGPFEDVSEFVLSNISSRLAGSIRDALQGYVELKPEEVEDEHRKFLSQLMQLKRDGVINLE